MIVSKLLPGIFHNTGKILVSTYWRTSPSAYIAINKDGSLGFRRLHPNSGFPMAIETKWLRVGDIDLPVSQIGMDKSGVVRIISHLGIEYPLHYNKDIFPTPDYCTLLSDCSLGGYKNGSLVYRARII